MLIFIKILHTLIWAIMAAATLAIPVAAALRRFGWALALTVVVLAECAVLGINGGRCPLTGLAARFTSNRADNFDIYLPLWLAHYNKVIFGALFVAGEMVLLGLWLKEKYLQHASTRARE